MATGASPNSSITAYATGEDMLQSRDWRQVADLLQDPTTRTGASTSPASRVAALALFTTEDAVGYRALRWASGQIEAAVTCGARYSPEDMLELTESQTASQAQGGGSGYTVARDLIVGLCCDLAFWWLVKRRKPGVKPDQVAGVQEALDLLERLRLGERVFPIGESQQAGLASVVPLDTETRVTEAAEPLSVRAGRFFGSRR